MSDITDVQLLIGDVSATQFTTAQIQAFLDLEGGVIKLGAAVALDAWLAVLTRQVTNEKIGDYGYGKTALYLMANLAKKLRDDVAETPAFDWAEMDLMGVKETL